MESKGHKYNMQCNEKREIKKRQDKINIYL